MWLNDRYRQWQTARAQRYLRRYPALGIDVLRGAPDLAGHALERYAEMQAASGQHGPERESLQWPFLGLGYGGRAPIMRTLPKPTPVNLRAFSHYPPARRAINVLSNPILELPFTITVRRPLGMKTHDKPADPTTDQHRRIVAATEMFIRPNNEIDGREFLEMLLEDLIVLGAGPFEAEDNTSDDRPLFLWPVDTQSIRMNAQWTPGSETYRYSQGKGALGGSFSITDDVKFLDSQLCYPKLNPRTNTPFGLGYLEVAFDCYSDDTEVLTRSGWIPWSVATQDDEFATRQPLTGIFEWQKPLRMHKVAYKGDMIQFKSQSTDSLVSPNHRMFGRTAVRDGAWRKRGDNTTLYGLCDFLSAERVAALPTYGGSSGFQVPTRSLWKGTACPESITLSCEGGTRGVQPKSYQVAFRDWVAFLGIYVAEGSAAGTKAKRAWKQTRQYRVTISQAQSSPHRQTIKELLWRMPFTWTEYEHGFYCVSKALHAAVFPMGNSAGKYVPSCVKEAPPDVIRMFIEWACMGDGSTRETGLLSYGTVSKRLADDMQELFQKSGTSASVSCYQRKPGALPEGRWLDVSQPLYYVMEQRSEFDGIGKASRIPYDGYIYCATVPNETLYVRRNGKALWCGNTVNAFIGAMAYAERRASNSTPTFGLFLGENMTPEQVRHFQHYWENEIEGAGKIPILGGGRQPTPFSFFGTGKDSLWLAWQEWLVRVIAMAFGVSPMRLGLERDVNKSTAAQGANDDWATVAPVANTIRNSYTHWILWKRLGWTDLEFAWQVKSSDELRQANILALQYAMNAITVDEIRQVYERPPLEDGLGDMTRSAYETAIKAASGASLDQEPSIAEERQGPRLAAMSPFPEEDPDFLSPSEMAFLRELSARTTIEDIEDAVAAG